MNTEVISNQCSVISAQTPSAEAIRIRVRATGSDNHARVLGVGVTASCTSSPKHAAERAAVKFFGERKFALREVKRGSCAGAEPYEFLAEPVAVATAPGRTRRTSGTGRNIGGHEQI